MQKYNFIIFMFIVVIAFLLSIWMYREYNKPHPVQANQTVLDAKYFSPEDFYEGKIKADSIKSEWSGKKVSGGIIPHHLLPGYILSDFFAKLSLQNPRRIILIGPNHYEKGGSKPITSRANWVTQFGQLNSDSEFLDKLIGDGILVQNDDVTVDEHSIGGILHYIKYYIPNAKVIPVIMSSSSTSEEISKLADSLQKYIDDDTVVIASVDFSHYLNSSEAKENDKITKKIMNQFDFENLYRLNNDYVDSPASIGLLLNLMQKQSVINQEILFNTNSGEILKDDSIQTTSYFSIFFTK